MNGCNYFGKTTIRSAPFAIFSRTDLLRLALEMNQWYSENKYFFPGDIDSIIPEIYGSIVDDENGGLKTTGAQRTGCQMCGFGIHLEKRPHRFDKLYIRNPGNWRFWMFECCVDKETGERFGWARVLDYIGVDWRPETMPVEQIKIEV